MRIKTIGQANRSQSQRKINKFWDRVKVYWWIAADGLWVEHPNGGAASYLKARNWRQARKIALRLKKEGYKNIEVRRVVRGNSKRSQWYEFIG